MSSIRAWYIISVAAVFLGGTSQDVLFLAPAIAREGDQVISVCLALNTSRIGIEFGGRLICGISEEKQIINEDKYRCFTDIRENEARLVLVITNVTLNDGGLYTCGGPERLENASFLVEVEEAVDRGWSEWSKWISDPCPVSSGWAEVQRRRTRECNNSFPWNVGSTCSEESVESHNVICGPERCSECPNSVLIIVLSAGTGVVITSWCGLGIVTLRRCRRDEKIRKRQLEDRRREEERRERRIRESEPRRIPPPANGRV